MGHFSMEDWADFARGVMPRDGKAAMDSHLQEGCARCSEMLGLWHMVHLVARRQKGLAPPDPAVRIAKALYDQAPFAKQAKVAIAELLFDSFRAPLTAGVRSGVGAATRQVLYGAGTHRIDVCLEPQADSGKVTVTGQVLDSVQPEKNLHGLQVRLVSQNTVLASSTTTSFGEFLFEDISANELELRVKLAGAKEVRASLIQSQADPEHPVRDRDDSVRVKANRRRSHKSTRKKG